MYQFSELTLQLLHTCNWSVHRNIDIERYKDFFISSHQPTSSVIFEFLASFGGLTIKFPNKKNPSVLNSLTLDPIAAGEDLGNNILRYYREYWIQRPSCAVGHFQHHDTLFMSITGELYIVFEQKVIKYANIVPKALENILEGSNYELVEKPDTRSVNDVLLTFQGSDNT
jgi:hypothetical protein